MGALWIIFLLGVNIIVTGAAIFNGIAHTAVKSDILEQKRIMELYERPHVCAPRECRRETKLEEKINIFKCYGFTRIPKM